MKAYIASSLDNADEARAITEALELDGWTITYRWFDHGSAQDRGEAGIREVAQAELDGVVGADLVIVALPGARGTHVELGIAIGCMLLGERRLVSGPGAVIIFGRGEKAFDDYRARTNDWSPSGHHQSGAFHDAAGRICSFYLHPGVHLVEKDRGLDGLRLEALRVTGYAPRPPAKVAEPAGAA